MFFSCTIYCVALFYPFLILNIFSRISSYIFFLNFFFVDNCRWLFLTNSTGPIILAICWISSFIFQLQFSRVSNLLLLCPAWKITLIPGESKQWADCVLLLSAWITVLPKAPHGVFSWSVMMTWMRKIGIILGLVNDIYLQILHFPLLLGNKYDEDIQIGDLIAAGVTSNSLYHCDKNGCCKNWNCP